MKEISKLEKLTHLFLIAVCAFSLFVLVKRNFIPQAPSGNAVRFSRIGKTLPIRGVDWTKSPTNVVLGIRSNCHYCIASLPYYKEIADNEKKTKISLFAVSTESPAVTSEFLSRAGIRVDGVFQSDFKSVYIAGTPTVYVVDTKGVIRNEFVGAGHEEAIFSRLGMEASAAIPAQIGQPGN